MFMGVNSLIVLELEEPKLSLFQAAWDAPSAT